VDIGTDALEPAADTLRRLYETVVAHLPLVGLGVVILLVGLVLARLVASGVGRGLQRTHADRAAIGLLTQLAKLAVVVAAVLVAADIAGLEVGPVLAGLGLAGLALAFALQSILENVVAGVILLIRKPFRAGDEIRSADFAGTVVDVDLRVTKITSFDGELVLIPNIDVYSNPVVNVTRRGTRRTQVVVGIDYRDDHDRAREVLRGAVEAVEGVRPDPPVQVLLTELGDSSVDFEIAYWTAPDNRTVRLTRDRVLSAAKRAVEEAGLTIPWPIRTLIVDGPVPLQRADGE
jgi:small conductance mechanosensitive channel